MKSQALVIDLTGAKRERHKPHLAYHRHLDIGDVLVFNYEPEYPGMEKIQGKVVWESFTALADARLTERDQTVHELFKKFAKATGSKISSIRHVDLVTYVDFKPDDIKNVGDMEWMSMVLEKEVHV